MVSKSGFSLHSSAAEAAVLFLRRLRRRAEQFAPRFEPLGPGVGSGGHQGHRVGSGLAELAERGRPGGRRLVSLQALGPGLHQHLLRAAHHQRPMLPILEGRDRGGRFFVCGHAVPLRVLALLCRHPGLAGHTQGRMGGGLWSTPQPISTPASMRWPRPKSASPACSRPMAGPSRESARRASPPCSERSSASRSASPRRGRCGTNWKRGRLAARSQSPAQSQRRGASRRRPVAAESGLCAQPRRAGPVGRTRPRQSARGRRGSDRAVDQDQGHRPLVGGNLSVVLGRPARRLARGRPRRAGRDRAG